MTVHVADVMTRDPLLVSADTLLCHAAQLMRDHDIGDLLVVRGDEVRGVVTDRDIVVRAVAEESNPRSRTVGETCSRVSVTIDVGATADEAADAMRTAAVRRLPVVEDGRLVGIVSLGDLAVAADPDSALADISAAPGTT